MILKVGDKIMDAIDIKILEELKEDARRSFSDIAEDVGKTEATIRRRVKKLVKKDIIKKFTIQYQIDNKTKVRATIKIEPDFKNIKQILRQLSQIEEITDIWRLSGDCGIFIKIEIPTIEDFNPLLEGKISQIDGIKIIETCFITDIIK
ncbi:MAG: Lrp/AsnC family transcriptional regulator [Promethearchaeota archaeon]|nr:MAG: Lrp/AsnC family transcriptional regulator [Candidatus Lokiarchaeota archaeon]